MSAFRRLNRELDNLEGVTVVSSSRVCPKCQSSKLRSIIFGQSDVVIDSCPECHGVWLDRSEFDSITTYLREERRTPRRRKLQKNFEMT